MGSRQVRCATDGCPREGVVRDVPDTLVRDGIVTRPALFCADCGTQLDGGASPNLEVTMTGPPENTAARAGRPRARR